MSSQHHRGYILLLAATWVLLLLTFFFNGISNVDATTLKWGVFTNTVANISDEFYLEITPAGWTFSIWGFIYTYQIIWMIYATVNIFRKTSDGTPLYTAVPFLHWSLFIIYMINLTCNISWLLLWDRKMLIAAVFPISILAVTMYTNAAISIHGAFKYHTTLLEKGFKYECWYIYGFVTNAFGMYGTWVTVATLLNLGGILTYRSGIYQPVASAACLSILTFEIMIWVLVDLAFFEKFTRFIYTPYIVLVVALSGSLSKNFDKTKPNSVFTVMLLLVSLVMLGVKIGLVIYRQLKSPIFNKEKEDVYS